MGDDEPVETPPAEDANIDYEQYVRTIADPTVPWPEYRSPIERSFTRFYVLDVGNNALHDQYVHQHRNGLCMVGLATSHPILAHRLALATVSFAVAALQISGKHKRGAMFVQPETVLARAATTDGTTFAIRAGVRGHLIELNERIVRDPALLRNKPEFDGYVGVIQPHKNVTFTPPHYITRDAYQRERPDFCTPQVL